MDAVRYLYGGRLYELMNMHTNRHQGHWYRSGEANMYERNYGGDGCIGIRSSGFVKHLTTWSHPESWTMYRAYAID